MINKCQRCPNTRDIKCGHDGTPRADWQNAFRVGKNALEFVEGVNPAGVITANVSQQVSTMRTGDYCNSWEDTFG